MYKNAFQLSGNKTIAKIAPNSIKVAEELLEEISEFQKNIPIIAVFSNPGLKQRHFNEIIQLIKYDGENISRKSNLYLNKVLSMGVGKHI